MSLANYPGQWIEQANCASVGSHVFFQEKGESTRRAKTICRSCPVQADCLEYALDNIEEHGIWAGYSRRGLQELRSNDDKRASVLAELRDAG